MDYVSKRDYLEVSAFRMAEEAPTRPKPPADGNYKLWTKIPRKQLPEGEQKVANSRVELKLRKELPT